MAQGTSKRKKQLKHWRFVSCVWKRIWIFGFNAKEPENN
jgi:hypothetical protein